MFKHLVVMVCCLLVLSACSPSEPAKIAEPQREALEKAKEIAASQEALAESAKKAIDEQAQ